MDGLPSSLASSSWARTQFKCKTKRNAEAEAEAEAEDELLQGGTDCAGVQVGVGRQAKGVAEAATFSLSNTCAVHYLCYNLLLYERREKQKLVDRSLP